MPYKLPPEPLIKPHVEEYVRQQQKSPPPPPPRGARMTKRQEALMNAAPGQRYPAVRGREEDVFSEASMDTGSVSGYTDLREEMDNLREEMRALHAARFVPPPEYES